MSDAPKRSGSSSPSKASGYAEICVSRRILAFQKKKETYLVEEPIA
jgi:hypothetical protein